MHEYRDWPIASTVTSRASNCWRSDYRREHSSAGPSRQADPGSRGRLRGRRAPTTALARAAAAVLAAASAALSHESALALWDLNDWPATPEVTAPQGEA